MGNNYDLFLKLSVPPNEKRKENIWVLSIRLQELFLANLIKLIQLEQKNLRTGVINFRFTNEDISSKPIIWQTPLNLH